VTKKEIGRSEISPRCGHDVRQNIIASLHSMRLVDL
jgi:hypothetical protein